MIFRVEWTPPARRDVTRLSPKVAGAVVTFVESRLAGERTPTRQARQRDAGRAVQCPQRRLPGAVPAGSGARRDPRRSRRPPVARLPAALSRHLLDPGPGRHEVRHDQQRRTATGTHSAAHHDRLAGVERDCSELQALRLVGEHGQSVRHQAHPQQEQVAVPRGDPLAIPRRSGVMIQGPWIYQPTSRSSSRPRDRPRSLHGGSSSPSRCDPSHCRTTRSSSAAASMASARSSKMSLTSRRAGVTGRLPRRGYGGGEHGGRPSRSRQRSFRASPPDPGSARLGRSADPALAGWRGHGEGCVLGDRGVWLPVIWAAVAHLEVFPRTSW